MMLPWPAGAFSRLAAGRYAADDLASLLGRWSSRAGTRRHGERGKSEDDNGKAAADHWKLLQVE